MACITHLKDVSGSLSAHTGVMFPCFSKEYLQELYESDDFVRDGEALIPQSLTAHRRVRFERRELARRHEAAAYMNTQFGYDTEVKGEVLSIRRSRIWYHLEHTKDGLYSINGRTPVSLGSALWNIERDFDMSLFQNPLDERDFSVINGRENDTLEWLDKSIAAKSSVLVFSDHLSCYFPVEIGQLSHLTIVSAHLDQEALPWEMGKLTRLRQLTLSKDGTSFALPKSMANWKNLRRMELDNVKFIPNDISELKDLHTLKISHSPFFSLPDLLTTLPNLERLQLLGLPNLEELPDGIFQMKRLKTIEISGTRLERIPSYSSSKVKLIKLINNPLLPRYTETATTSIIQR